MKIFVTGGCGFLGTNLTASLLEDNHEVYLLDNLSRLGSHQNLKWLKSKGSFEFIQEDIRNQKRLEKLIQTIRPEIVYHLSGQVAMTSSIEDPRNDFEINALGTFNLLEAVRRFSPQSAVIYSSTNKVYGDLKWVHYSETEKRYVADEYPEGFPENIPLDFHSPYGNSKGCADQYMLDYARIYHIKTVVFRHSSMYGSRQFSTFDQGWVGWFCQQALRQKNGKNKEAFTISGSGKQVRDLLFADDLVKLYKKAAGEIDKIKGEAFNIGGGMDNSLSICELFEILQQQLDIKLNYKKIEPRISDQKIFVADISKFNSRINWHPKVDKVSGIQKMITWTKNGQLSS